VTPLRFILVMCLLYLPTQNFGQEKGVKSEKKNYCDWTGCTLKPQDPAHFDPYYNGHLCENFNPEQVDFSKEYFDLQTNRYLNADRNIRKNVNCNFSKIWTTNNFEQNGVLGQNYRRIHIHIDKVIVGKSFGTYLVIGKSKVDNKICTFKGTIKLLKIFPNDSCDNSEYKKCGDLFAEYMFYEDSSQNHSGIFHGITECSFFKDSTGKSAYVDESMSGADGYWNRTFVGTWSEYKTGIVKKCIWGDYRLPFTFDFDCGDGEMMVSGKYKKNGWQTFADGSEFVSNGKGKWKLKNRWWEAKK